MAIDTAKRAKQLSIRFSSCHCNGPSPADSLPYQLTLWPDSRVANCIGSAFDIVLCALLRAQAVTLLLNNEFFDPERERLGDDFIHAE